MEIRRIQEKRQAEKRRVHVRNALQRRHLRVRRQIGSMLLWAFLSLLAAIILCPIVFLVSGSFMGNDELAGYLGAVFLGSEGYAAFPLLPKFPTLKHYVEILLDSPKFFVMFWNSVKITAGVLIGQLVVGTMAAWGFAKYEFPWKRGFFLLYLILMLLPFQVLMLSNYLVLDFFRLTDSLWGVILPGVFSTFPVFIMYRFFSEIPDSLTVTGVNTAPVTCIGGNVFFC